MFRIRRRPPGAAPARLGWPATPLAGLIALCVAATPGSMAYLQAATSAGAVTLTTGSAGLSLTPGTGGAPAPYAGRVFTANALQADTVTNTGSVPLQLSATATASNTSPGTFGAALSFTVSSGGTAMWSGSAASGSSAAGPMLAPGATAAVHIDYEIPPGTATGALANATTAFTITITGTQVAP